MTPKEKAKELINKYSSWVRDYDISKYSIINQKECALIAVDEILNTLSIEPIRVNNKYQTLKYWQEVKQEIEKL
jgi:hypothetical protein